MRKSALSPDEIKVCRRLKIMRDKLGLTQDEVAIRVGIERGTLANYEYERAPLRCDIGLKICRQLIVSEEWLATGDYSHCKNAVKEALSINKYDELEDFFFRRAYDLISEPVYLRVNPTTSFLQAWQNCLSSEYERISRESIYAPRIVFRDDDANTLMTEILNVIISEKLKLLHNEALRMKGNPGLTKRTYTRCIFEIQDILFKRFLGFPTPEIQDDVYNWIRVVGNHIKDPIGPLSNYILSSTLDKRDESAILSDMPKGRWEKIQSQLKDVSVLIGGQSKLSKELGVSRQSISQWINGESIPSADNVLLILDYLENFKKEKI